MAEDSVEDSEVLYRRVRCDCYIFREGVWRLSSETFNDVGWKPSVDRKKLRDSAEQCKFEASDGIAELLANEVRSIDSIVHNTDAKPPEPKVCYKVDVHPRPIPKENAENLPENLAHAQIESAPHIASKARFNKLKDALLRLANRRPLVIEPAKTGVA